MWSGLRTTPDKEAPVPEWLTSALGRMTHPKQLQGGTRALADLAGRTPDHVAARQNDGWESRRRSW